MSPQQAERWKRAAPHLAHGGIYGALFMLWSTGLLDAFAERLRGDDGPSDHAAIVAEAVRQADAHAKALIAEGVTPLRADVQELTKQVSRMAGYLEAMKDERGKR